jgi:hypothetical protein
VLIDGGAGQLSIATQVFEELGVQGVAYVGIAKGPDRNAGREQFFIPGREPFQLPMDDAVLHYLQRLRDLKAPLASVLMEEAVMSTLTGDTAAPYPLALCVSVYSPPINTAAATPSGSGSVSVTATASASPTPSLTPSQLSTPTSTNSLGASVSASPSQTATPTPTASPSPTAPPTILI